MSVQPGPTDKRYAANGVSTIYTVPFLVIEAGDLNVYLNDVLMTSGYTHTGIGNPTSALTFTTPPLGDLYLLLDVPFQRLTDYQDNGDLLAETLNRDFDRIWQALKQLYGWAIRSLRLGAFDIDGQGSYRANGNGITGLASAGTDASAATNLKDVRDYVASILETGQGPVNNAANVVYVRPSGVAGSVQDLATGEGYDYVGATLPTGVFSTVKGFFNWILDRITLSTSGSASIVAAVAKGGKVVIKNGGHYMSATAECDYGVEPIVGFPGHESKRFDVAGETMGGTILSVQHSGYALVFSGSYLPDPPHVTQNVAGFDSVSNLTLVGASVTAPNTTDTGGFGLLVRKKAYTSIRRIAALNLRIGLHLDGVLSSTVEDYTIEGCYVGAIFEDFNSFSGPNGMHFRRIKIGGSTDLALRSDIGAAMNFDNLTIENCGVMPSSRFVATFINQPGQWAGAVNYMSSYCENNAGYADYNFENNSTHPLVINMNGSMFQRNSPSRYTGVNIRLNSVGGGRVTMKIGTTSFLSSLGYVPSASRPFFIVGANCEVIWDESCAFSETTSLAYWLCLHRAYSFSVAADGTILSGPDGFACTALGGGIYRFYRTSGVADFAKFADDYSIHPSSTDVNVYISVVSNKTSSYFDVTMSNNVTGVNAKFDVTIRRNKGYYS